MELTFIFKSLEQNHLELLCNWFNKEHIKEWWDAGLSDKEIKLKYKKRIDDQSVFSFIAYVGDKAFGFIQYYYTNKIHDGSFSDEMKGTIGIDQFIAEKDDLNHGYGAQMIGQFIKDFIFNNKKIKKIVIDVDEKNHRAIRCYQKLGFCFSHNEIRQGKVVTIMNKHRNINIETLAARLKKPDTGTVLYKIISNENFIDMLKNSYLYFRRVDTYTDDKRDSDQPDQDKEISEKSKFEKANYFSLKNYYDSCRSKTYACCFSTENSSHIWRNYGEDGLSAICILFDCHKLINFLNSIFDEARLIYNNKILLNFFCINYGLVNYGSFDSLFLKEFLPNPLEYVYFKDADKYEEEKEFRISLSCLGICKYVWPDGTEFTFSDSLKLSFDFAEAIRNHVVKKIIINSKLLDKEKIKTDLKKILEAKGISQIPIYEFKE